MAEKEEKQNNTIEFFIGVILLAVGLFILSKRVVVTTRMV